jgi:multimeric flavodoxin WrbA
MAAEIVAILASPRRGGNSETLLRRALRHFPSEKIKTIRAASLKLSACEACGWCDTRGKCRIKDDFQKTSAAILSARAVVVASPIYFYGLPSKFKALIDRSQCLWARKYILKKKPPPARPAYTILVGATKGAKLFDGALLTLKYFYDVYNLRPAGSVLVRNVDEKKAAAANKAALRAAARLIKPASK